MQKTGQILKKQNPVKFWESIWRGDSSINASSRCAEIVLPEPAGKKVLEIGSGNASNSSLAEDAGNYVGIDLSMNALKSAKRDHPNGEFIQAAAQRLPFRPGVFDAVVAAETLPLIPWLLPRVMKEASRVTAAEGEVCFDVSHMDAAKPLLAPDDYIGKRIYGTVVKSEGLAAICMTESEVEWLLSIAGLKVKEIRTLTSFEWASMFVPIYEPVYVRNGDAKAVMIVHATKK